MGLHKCMVLVDTYVCELCAHVIHRFYTRQPVQYTHTGCEAMHIINACRVGQWSQNEISRSFGQVHVHFHKDSQADSYFLINL